MTFAAAYTASGHHAMIRLRPLLVLLLASLLPVLSGCGKGGPEVGGPAGGPGGAMKGRMAFPVDITEVHARPMVYRVTAVGSVDAFEVVQVTARVAGVVDRVRFQEGTRVAAGQGLVDIEQDRYRLAVQSAQATLAKAQAAKADAEAGLARREGAVAKNPGIIPGEEIETWRTKSLAAAADVAQAKAASDQADLNLRDARVLAPVAGLIQTRSVQTGQYVQPGAVLATLVRRDPLLLRFKVTEQDAARIRAGDPATFVVRNDKQEYRARITFVAASAEEQSRMVPITAEVTDAARATLRPGTFAEVRVPIGEARATPVIPQTAVRASERGFLAYVVQGDRAVERVLTLGLRTDDGQVEVLAGLAAGERVVVRGGEALRDGAQVRPAGTKPAPQKDGRTRP
jgi:membrane fusion protein, multidrug efflux system